MSKFTTMAFREMGDGTLTQIVGNKNLFKSKKDFLLWCLTDCEELEYDFQDQTQNWTIDNIVESYVRYYSHMPEGFNIESGYTFCNKGKGAFEVYVLDLR